MTENGEYDEELPSFTDAGTYIVWYKASAPNHEDAKGTFEVKVSPKRIYANWGANDYIPYTGEDKLPQPVADGDVCTLTAKWVETDEGVGVIPGYWTATVDTISSTNYEIINHTVKFHIVKGYQDKPEVSCTDETISVKADGKITGVDSTMEYRKEGETDYTAVSGSEVGNLPAGKYYVRYKENQYYNPSPYTEVVIAEGRKLSVTVPSEQTGYTLTAETDEILWHEETTLTFELSDGYSKSDAFEVTATGASITDNGDGTYAVSNAEDDVVVSVTGVVDDVAPTANVTLEDNWNTFWNNITFGIFFNETKTFTITAEDNGSGVNKIYYYLSDTELTKDKVKTMTDWTEYTAPVKVDPDKVFAIYAKVTDKAGNVVFINSDGFVLDRTMPMLHGIEDGGVYYGDKLFRLVETNLKSLVVDETDVTDTLEGDWDYTISADNKEHTVTATDKAGNVTEYKITVYKIYTVTFTDENGVYKTVKVNHGEKAELPEPPQKDGYIVKWEAVPESVTGDLTVKAIYTEIIENDDSKGEDSKEDEPKNEESKKEDPKEDDSENEDTENENTGNDSLAGPTTGDHSSILLWAVIALVSCGALIFLEKKKYN